MDQDKNLRDIGRDAGLGGELLDLFCAYVERRFPDATWDYIKEWAERFRNGKAWEKSDLGGRMTLMQLGYNMGALYGT